MRQAGKDHRVEDETVTISSNRSEKAISRRSALSSGLALATVAGAGTLSGIPVLGITEARAEPSLKELLAPGPLPEKVLGDATAPNTLIEYSSLTCPHCASFHKKVVPELKLKYIETGKVRYIVREFPLGTMAFAAAMLTRCVADDKYFAFLGVLFQKQEEWAPGPKEGRQARLFKMAQQAGFTQETFEKCLTDNELRDGITEIRQKAAETFGVNSTPTVFVNGKMVKGPQTMAEINKYLKP